MPNTTRLSLERELQECLDQLDYYRALRFPSRIAYYNRRIDDIMDCLSRVD